KLDHTRETDDAYNTDCYSNSRSRKIKEGKTRSSKMRKESYRKEINEDLYNREKGKEIEYEENDLAEFVQEVLSHCDAIFRKITKRREETPRTNSANYAICKTKNKVNVPKIYQKNEVISKGSFCGNSDGKVLIVNERFLDDNSSIAKKLCKNRRNMEEKARSDLKAQGDSNGVANFERIEKDKKGTCFDSLENDKFNNRKFWKFDQKKEEKVETIHLGPKEIMNSKVQRDNDRRMLIGDREGCIEEQCNSMDKRTGKRRNEKTYQDETYGKNIG
ncbi:17_t:CDS:2, partial [Gigaspora margarita]